MNRNIELIRYAKYGNEFLLLELVGRAEAAAPSAPEPYKDAEEWLATVPAPLLDVYHATRTFLLSLGDDVQMNTLKLYFAFKRIKNFACVEVLAKKLRVFVKVDPSSIKLEPGFTRDVTTVGHWGTGDLEITLCSLDDLERAKPLLLKSYEAS
jgi:predicted transport protein